MADPGKTEKPTPRRIQDARERGQVARSLEVNTVVILFACLLMFRYGGGYIIGTLGEAARYSFGNLGMHLGIETVQSLFLFVLWEIFRVIAPILGTILIVSLLVNYLQVGVLFTPKPLIPKWENVNPVAGFKKIFSMRSLVEAIKTCLKLALILWVSYATVKAAIPNLIPTMDMSSSDALQYIGLLTYKVLLRIIGVMFVIAILDYAYQRWHYMDSLKMTHQEVRDELKQSEGDPLMKSRVRQIQREIARARMFDAIPRADVVITNPSHVAVALEYKDKMRAPRVLAKGERVVALRIKEAARQHNIPIVENPPLARALFKSCPVGADIPGDLYETVAEVLAFVYRMNRKGAA
jgi:flagellar biosynthetic protein FlhB